MSDNYFAIERNGRCWTSLTLKSRNGDSDFSELMDMTYDEMKSNNNIEKFVIAAMQATNEISGTEDDQTIVNLVGQDGVFIWGIVMGPGENGEIRYLFVNWKKDGKNYRYEP